MKILIITGIFPPDIGGPASHVPTIAESLCAKGHPITVLTLSDHPQTDAYPYMLIRIPRLIPKPLRFLLTLGKILWHGNRADILYVHGLRLEAALANYILRKTLIHKVVGDWAWEKARTKNWTQDSFDEFQSRSYPTKIQMLKHIRNFSLGKGTSWIVPSQYLKRILVSWGIPEQKINVILNAISPFHKRLTQAVKPMPSRRRLISIGRLTPWKGFENLIEMMTDIPNAELVIIGSGPEERHLRSLIQKRDLQDRVHLKGSLLPPELNAELSAADIFVLNSRYEGLPHVLLEAMSAGIPVVATDVGGVREIIQDGINGFLVKPGDKKALHQHLEKLLRDPELCLRIGAANKQSLHANSTENMVHHTEQLMRSLCNSSISLVR